MASAERPTERHWKPHTLYPILLHHSIISGMAALFMPRPDLRMASTIAKLDCSVFNAATAAYRVRSILPIDGCAYCIITLIHSGYTVIPSSN